MIEKLVKYFPANWRTSLAGIISIFAAGVGVKYPELAPMVALIVGALNGLGNLAAKDAKE